MIFTQRKFLGASLGLGAKMNLATVRNLGIAVSVATLTACGGTSGDPSSSSSSAMSSSSTMSSSSSSSVSSSSSSVSSSVSSSSSSSSSVSYQVPANNFAENGTVENGITNWGGRGDAQIERSTADKYAGSASLLVTNRGDYWHGATFNVGNLTAGNEYEVAAWVKLAPGEPNETIKITAKRQDDSDDSTYLEYQEVASAVVTDSEWTLLLADAYIPDGTTPFDYFIIEAGEGSTNVSFYVDNFSIGGEVEDDPIIVVPPGDGLASLTNIPIGVAVNLEGGGRDTFNSSTRTAIVRDEFSQMSVENSMKMSYWNESNFSNSRVDTLAQWARNNGKTIHGHTLVWHPCYQMPSWASNSGAAYEQALTRHIQGVASQHTDVIKSWDVVNEALQDGNDDSQSGCRYEGGGEVVNGVNYRKSAHYLGMGANYIPHAFREARKAAPNAELYYNDFNTENGQAKTDSLVNLVDNLVNAGVPIDGVGFQMHVLPDWPSISTIKASWQRILDLNHGLKIKITELDVRVNNQYANPPQVINSCNNCPQLQSQKQRYKDIIKAYFETVPANLRGGITVWGISDPDSWFASDPDWPLLWDGNLNPKPAYYGVQEGLAESN